MRWMKSSCSRSCSAARCSSGHVLHHAHFHEHTVEARRTAHARAHPAHLTIGATPAVLEVAPIAGLAGLDEGVHVLGQDAAERTLGADPLLALEPGDIAQAAGPQQHGFALIPDAAPVAGACQPLHGAVHLGLFVLLAPHILKQGVRLLLPCTQGFQFGQILHGDQNAANASAVGMDLPGQHQTALFTQHMAAFQRIPGAHHGGQLLLQVRARQQHKHIGGRCPRIAHRAQPLQASRCSVGGDQAQFRAMLMEPEQRHGHRIQHGLQARLHRQQRGVIGSRSKGLKHGRGSGHAVAFGGIETPSGAAVGLV
jgi:hypothetical protein